MATEYQTIYILASGMLLQERKLEVSSNNLANVNTPAFKKDFLTALSYYIPEGEKLQTTNPYEPSNNYVYPIVERVEHILSQGSLVKTGNPLDLAIEGEGFFAVRMPDGSIAYTRKGIFRLNDEGILTTEEGYPVLDESLNPIRVEGEFKITKDGTYYINGVPSGRLGIFNLQNARKIGNDFFTGNALPSQNYRIFQGFYEASNVNAIKEMIKLIDTVRANEMFSKLIRMNDEVMGRLNESI